MASSERIAGLQRETEALKKQFPEARRNHPPEPVQGHAFPGANGEKVSLSQRFGDTDDLLIIRNMGRGRV